MSLAESLVPEDAPDLVDALVAAHEQPLQVQLQADAQRPRLAEGLRVRLEWSRRCASRLLLQHRRLHLEEAAFVEVSANRRHDPAPRPERIPNLLVREQVEVTLALPDLDVGQAVELLGRRPQRLRDHLPRGRAHGRFPRPRPHG